MRGVQRSWVKRRERAFLKTPCFALLADSQMGRAGRRMAGLGGQTFIACELKGNTRSFYTYVSFVGAACLEACIIGGSGMNEFGVSW